MWDSAIVLCFVVRYFVSYTGFAIILMGEKMLVALLCLSSWCLVIVVWLLLEVPQVCLQFVVFPDHTHLLFIGLSDLILECERVGCFSIFMCVSHWVCVCLNVSSSSCNRFVCNCGISWP